ncbi:S-methyl-5-thioribose-1-phosphate isomerase [Alicyclobacillus dauci]|uniref:Methylthioribose-1-phosphate isomerase n=1 Tax=Alicyclobacillus dauci TaxID=1475485 RepID=A0ABY6YXB1_9BACL|nr:S-methyl-5-thioribose-1-phosphate isomerase [Alicyclobacillus dauci]WAH35146.1 S-methyl-5-thioribose-1-phosphate isomerase [Alicyclobacillus dauci]
MDAIRWSPEELKLLDQTKLPHQQVWETYAEATSIADAIRAMKVRGAPAIGAAGAFAVAIEARRLAGQPDMRERLERAITVLHDARPTAVNLAWALNLMRQLIDETSDEALPVILYNKALQIAEEDVKTNHAIGDYGAQLFNRPTRILTHCNTGALATVGYGTALGIIRSLHHQGKLQHVYVDETRPYLQGARLTAYELADEGIPFDIITDSMAGHFMQQGVVDAVIVGADRVARNGDTANKIGTYTLAVLAHHHEVPFYVAAPMSTIDLDTEKGEDIPIEQRNMEEVTHIFGQAIAPEGATALHPAFDVTPGGLITGIVTERGVVSAPYESTLRSLKNGEANE